LTSAGLAKAFLRGIAIASIKHTTSTQYIMDDWICEIHVSDNALSSQSNSVKIFQPEKLREENRPMMLAGQPHCGVVISIFKI
jgi:hypothetical protein